MTPYRSRITTHGRNMAGARGLWRATGMKEEDFGKPIIAMGHDGMLYSLPSRDLIADSVEYMVNAHCADALACVSNCDKITPGMLMAALRINIPAVFVSGGPMEAGRVSTGGATRAGDLIDALVTAADVTVTHAELTAIERSACPTRGSCSGMFTANSMNCLLEAIGLALPGNGTVFATHAERERLMRKAGSLIVELRRRFYQEDDASVLPRSIATYAAFENAMALDIAMSGSTNTVLHLLAAAYEPGVEFTMRDIDRLSRRIPSLCKVAPSKPDVHLEDVHRAGGVMAILGELERDDLIDGEVGTVHAKSLSAALDRWNVLRATDPSVSELYRAAPGGLRTVQPFSQAKRVAGLDLDRKAGVIRSTYHAYSEDGGLAVLYGNLAEEGCIVKTAGVDMTLRQFNGQAIVLESQETAVEAILGGRVSPGDVVVIRYEGPRGGPGMQEMLYPTSYLKAKGLGKACALITDGRFSGGTSGLSIGHISPEAAEGGLIALVEDGDAIRIDIPSRTIHLSVEPREIEHRRGMMLARGGHPWRPAQPRPRRVSAALRAYAALTTSASRGAVRQFAQITTR